MEYLGDGEFDYQRMIAFTGAYDSAMFDSDNDGVEEIVVVGFKPSVGELVDYGDQPNIAWLDYSNSTWTPVFPDNDIDAPLISLEVMDYDGDGQEELIAATHDISNTTNFPKLSSIYSTVSETCVEVN